MHRLAVLSYHTSPLVQPGTGDSGGMNVYVRELAGALAQAGVSCDVYTRTWAPDLPEVVDVEPGLRVVHVDAGPRAPVEHAALADLVPEWTERVASHLEVAEPSALHANYWLSGVAGHALKHELEVPLISTFHTLARVKAEGGDAESGRRAEEEARVVGCSDVICANCADEAHQLEHLYGAAPERIELVPLGVDHAFFSPGDQRGARAALGIGDQPVLLFVGRIQPLKGADVAVGALAELRRRHPTATLVLVGGPSGPQGPEELVRVQRLVDEHGLAGAVRFAPPQPHHLLSSYYRAADVVLVPSRSESFGLVALEAAACGVPVVAAAVGGLRTLVDDGRTGFLVERRDATVFARAAARVLEDRGLAVRMGEAAAARAGRYTWSTSAARLRRVYADVSSRQLVECR